MIYEYAVDPTLVVDWAVGRKGRFVGQFGMDQRRLVSDFPKHWADAVYGAFYEHFEYDDSSLDFQNAQPELQAYVQLLSDCTVYRNTAIPVDGNWLNEAVVEHGKQPFHAIMTSSVPEAACHAVITTDAMDDIRDARWYLPTVGPANKVAIDMAAALQPMLCKARYIVLVDPYFDASDERYQASFLAMVQSACLRRTAGQGLPRITVLTGVEQKHKPHEGVFTRDEMHRVADDLINKAARFLPALLPKGVSMDFYCLKHPDQGDPLHNRYVLTDIGGVTAPYGLAEYKSDQAHGAQDDLQPMLKGIYEARHRQYVDRKGLDIVSGPTKFESAA